MSSKGNELNITSEENFKDPKKVAAVKRLAQISKEEKERKLRERIQKEEGFDYFLIVTVGGLVLGGSSLYFAYKLYTKEDIKYETKTSKQPKRERPINALYSLD